MLISKSFLVLWLRSYTFSYCILFSDYYSVEHLIYFDYENAYMGYDNSA